MTSFIDKLRLGITAFKEAYLSSGVVDIADWSEQQARQLRYAIQWAWYEQTSYRDVHAWATRYRLDYSLYKYIRAIYNPAYRLGEFWKTHLFGGLLDSEAGEEGAIPIQTENENLRPAIANLWKWSRWQVQKDILTCRGTIMGDVAIQVVDDVERGRVYLALLHPGMIEYLERDPFGNVKGYTLSEVRDSPDGGPKTATYTEIVSRDGEYVVYETFLNGQPYAWPDNVDRSGEPVSQWAEPYGFVPLVVIQHNDTGLEWGWSELHPIRSKIHEVDDLASLLSDQIRKTIDPVWLMKGIKQTTLTMQGAANDADADRPAPGREEIQALWGIPVDGGAEAMVAELDSESTLLHIDSLLKEIERDLPELAQDIHTASGDASGRALRTARQPVVSKVIQRRNNYDSAMVAAHQMAIAIGGWRGQPEFAGFNLESYAKGDLEHSIAPRPVFEEDPLDEIEINTAFWEAAKQAKEAGLTLEAYLREAGWKDDRIAQLEIEEEPTVRPQVAPEGDETLTGG